MTKPKTVRVLPSAKRLINSLRDLGYETPEAVADLIDNSIAAGAHNVEIDVHFDGEYSWLRIADDGRGMDGGAITEAMRFGSQRDYEPDDLGKFGLGLKTASISQCRCVTVASRTSKSRARAEVRQLDLDHVEQHDSWDVLILGAHERPAEAVEPLAKRPGTVVLWEDLDRILPYKSPGGEWARRRLMNVAEHIEQHVGMVFHRFLAGEVPRHKLSIRINGSRVEPWDPFARDHAETESRPAQDFELHTSAGSGVVHVEPYVLPPRSSLSPDARRRLSGPNNWNRQQGFYIYRANRLIQSGGWSYMRTADEHTKLARIAITFSPDLDHALGINVAKMRVTLPVELKDLVSSTVEQTVKRAQVVYREKPDKPPPATAAASSPLAPTAGIGDDPGPVSDLGAVAPSTSAVAVATNSPADGATGVFSAAVASARRRALESAADAAEEREALKRIMRTLGDQHPEVARELGY
jgi:hypothetical protein